MKVYKKTVKSHSFNEDRFVFTRNLFGVIDGATDLSDCATKRKRSHASILVDRLKKAIEKASTSNLVELLEDLSKDCYQALGNMASCGISLVQVCDDKINLVSLGDCDILIKDKEGFVERYKQKELDILDKKAIGQMVEIARQKGISILDAREYINPLLIKHRSLKNKPNGYNVFEPMERPSFKCLSLSIDKDLIDSVIICSDGFAQAYTTLDVLSSFDRLFDKDCLLDSVIKEIINKSKSDPKCNKYPRFKMIDDITVVKVDF